LVLKSTGAATDQYGDPLLSSVTPVGRTLYFVAFDRSTGHELWKSDGTHQGTSLVKDIRPGAGSSFPRDLTDVNGTLFFTVYTSNTTVSIWKSDGTAQGTSPIKTISVPSGGVVSDVMNVNGVLFLAISGSTDVGQQLWRSDGTPDGTFLIKNVTYPGSDTFANWVSFLGSVDQKIFFAAQVDSTSRGLWVSDGTDQGTTLIKVMNPGSESTSLNGTLYFTADDGTSGQELWRSDGTPQNTVMVADINPGPIGALAPFNLTFCSLFYNQLMAFDGKLFFGANDGSHGYELWQSDGTTAGTMLVKDINPGEYSANPYRLTTLNGALFFAADDGSHGYELWRSDGTTAGTSLLVDISPGNEGSLVWYESAPSVLCPVFAYFNSLLSVNGRLFFGADDGQHGREIWTSTGTAADTTLVQDIASGAASAGPDVLGAAGTLLAFTAYDGQNRFGLWSLPLDSYCQLLPIIRQ
jgi:ELWxxDGT repeat protein